MPYGKSARPVSVKEKLEYLAGLIPSRITAYPVHRNLHVIVEPGGKFLGIPLLHILRYWIEYIHTGSRLRIGDGTDYEHKADSKDSQSSHILSVGNLKNSKALTLLQIPSQWSIFVHMKTTLLTVGKTDKAWVREGMDIYSSRLKHYTRLEICEIPELKNVSALSREEIKSREGALILKNIRNEDRVVLLDEKGEELSSVEFARRLEKYSAGRLDLVFVVGGAYGFSKEFYERADALISLSKMTFSHQMVRAIFLEQLYRAFTIIKGEPYHHE